MDPADADMMSKSYTLSKYISEGNSLHKSDCKKSLGPEDVIRIIRDREAMSPRRPKKEGIWDYDKPIYLTYEHQYEADDDQPILEKAEFYGVHPELLILAGLGDRDEMYLPKRRNTTGHPEFSTPMEIGSTEKMVDFWESSPKDFKEPRKHWSNLFRKQKSKMMLIENRVSNYCDNPDLLAMAGVITKDEAASFPKFVPDIKILANLMGCGEFPDNMDLIFLDGRLCVNEVVTTIREDDVKDLYNGHQAFNGSDEAIDYAVEVLKKRLLPLFKKEELPLFEGVQDA
jgi:hypothetical protein